MGSQEESEEITKTLLKLSSLNIGVSMGSLVGSQAKSLREKNNSLYLIFKK